MKASANYILGQGYDGVLGLASVTGDDWKEFSIVNQLVKADIITKENFFIPAMSFNVNTNLFVANITFGTDKFVGGSTGESDFTFLKKEMIVPAS